MYTPTIINKTYDQQSRQIVLDVEFSDGTTTISETIRFGADFDFDKIKRNLKKRAEMLEEGDTNANTITTGIINLNSVQDDSRTPAERQADDWLRDFERLQKVQVLIDLGVLTGNETPVTALRDTVSTNFKPAYISLF